MKYRFIDKHQHRFPIGRQCQVLDVSRSGYYAWRARRKKPEDTTIRALLEHIRRIHKKSRRTYGSPRVWFELRANGVVCNHKRVARLMRLEGLYGRRKRKKVITQRTVNTTIR